MIYNEGQDRVTPFGIYSIYNKLKKSQSRVTPFGIQIIKLNNKKRPHYIKVGFLIFIDNGY